METLQLRLDEDSTNGFFEVVFFLEDPVFWEVCHLGLFEVKAVVKYVGGFWPIGVFFAGYRSFFFVPSRHESTPLNTRIKKNSRGLLHCTSNLCSDFSKHILK